MLCEKKEKTVIAMFLSIFKESNFFSNPNLGTVLQVEVKEIKLLSAEMSPGRWICLTFSAQAATIFFPEISFF